MPFYHKLGNIPRKRHTQFYKPDGKSLYREELYSTLGFSGVYSNKYHINMPNSVYAVKELPIAENVDWPEAPLNFYHCFSNRKTKDGDFITSRMKFMENRHCIISTATPNRETDDFFKNAYANEYIFVHYGRPLFLSEYGQIQLEAGDQLIIPKGIPYQFKFKDLSKNKLLIVESDTPFDIPKHFRNPYGQLEEAAPYQERDFKIPEYMEPKDEKGEFRLVVQGGQRFFEYTLQHHPFDVVGWDGFHYPYAFNIRDYNPKVGRLHLPPPTHLAFNTGHFVLCNFCPRPFDFDPQAIPVPYWHSNCDSDEVLYYVEGDFMSRAGIEEGSFTLHPSGMPHGPQPGKTEASLGATETSEYAVMVDTFEPLRPTTHVRDTIDPNYSRSWLAK
ncbi:MAG: homogentisate 1,2-dioxygenase [bacterium]|nr:homogentisate 1,2-dioxygenase [bacterium]